MWCECERSNARHSNSEHSRIRAFPVRCIPRTVRSAPAPAHVLTCSRIPPVPAPCALPFPPCLLTCSHVWRPGRMPRHPSNRATRTVRASLRSGHARIRATGAIPVPCAPARRCAVRSYVHAPAHLLASLLASLPLPPNPSIPLQIRHSYTHCPCNPGASRRARTLPSLTFPQVTGMIPANSDIRDNCSDLRFQHSVVPVSSVRKRSVPAHISN